jgi:ABC-type dipeptide/oligopeptide/nickel transport system permease component
MTASRIRVLAVVIGMVLGSLIHVFTNQWWIGSLSAVAIVSIGMIWANRVAHNDHKNT